MNCPSTEIKEKKDYQHSLLEAYFHQLCLQIVNTGNKLYTWGTVQIFVAKRDWGYSANHWKGRTQQTQLWYKQQMNIHKSIDKMQLPNCVVCIFCAHTQDAVTNIYSKHFFFFFLYTQAPTSPNHMHTLWRTNKLTDSVYRGQDFRNLWCTKIQK